MSSKAIESTTALELEAAYEQMLILRAVEDAIGDLKAEGLVAGSVHQGSGQEAVPVGVVSQRAEEDLVFGNYRGHQWALACGVSPTALIGELCGRAIGICSGRGGSAQFTAPEVGFMGENAIIGAQVPMAVGAVLANRYDGSSRVAVTVFGDGASNQGAVFEAMNMAGAWRLPVIFVLENNVYSELTPIKAVTADVPLSRRGEPFGIPGVEVDGNDPLAVAEVAAAAFERARSGQGPTLIEAHTYRIVGHYIGDVESYRDADELEHAKQREPLVRARENLTSAISEEEIATIEARAERVVAEAVAEVRAAAPADAGAVKEHLYA